MHRVAWHDVTVTAPGKKNNASCKTLLSGASGYACSGDGNTGGIVALMGASGSGKTTLLTLLSGHAQVDTGAVTLDGRTYDNTTSELVGFVPQFDFLFESLTVMETLRLGSALRGARRSPAAADAPDDARLMELLTQLGLVQVASSRIGQANATGRRRGISGGERKRCALALALLDTPPLLVLDEPTSGLDSRAAVDVLRVLSSLTAKQAVVISLHQPSAKAFGLVGQLGLLSPSGATLFFGSPRVAIEHFARLGRPVPPYTNPAEHYIDLAADAEDVKMQELLLGAADEMATGRAIARALLAADDAGAAATAASAAARRDIGFWSQLRALHWRATTHNRRHPAFMRAMGSRSVAMALIVGYLYSGLDLSQKSVQDRTGALYFVLANQVTIFPAMALRIACQLPADCRPTACRLPGRLPADCPRLHARHPDHVRLGLDPHLRRRARHRRPRAQGAPLPPASLLRRALARRGGPPLCIRAPVRPAHLLPRRPRTHSRPALHLPRRRRARHPVRRVDRRARRRDDARR